MSAMGAFRRVARVVGKLPLLTENEIEDEPNLYKRGLSRNINQFNAQSATTEDKEKALVQIGHISYTADPECMDLIASFVYTVVKIIGDKEEPLSLQIQGVRTLSEMCHYNKFIIDKVWKSVRFKQIISGIIGDLDNPLLSCWGCYLLSIMVAHSVAFLRQIEAIPGLVTALRESAAYENDWQGFDRNIAAQVLRLSGQQIKAKFPEEASEKKDPDLPPTIRGATNEITMDTKPVRNALNRKSKWMGMFNKVAPAEVEDSEGKQTKREDTKEDTINEGDSKKE